MVEDGGSLHGHSGEQVRVRVRLVTGESAEHVVNVRDYGGVEGWMQAMRFELERTRFVLVGTAVYAATSIERLEPLT